MSFCLVFAFSYLHIWWLCRSSPEAKPGHAGQPLESQKCKVNNCSITEQFGGHKKIHTNKQDTLFYIFLMAVSENKVGVHIISDVENS